MSEQLAARLQRRRVDSLGEIGTCELRLTAHATFLIRCSSTIHSTRVRRPNKLRSHAKQSTSAAESAMSEDLRYPVGKFSARNRSPMRNARAAIDSIAAMPAKLRAAVRGLNESQLDTPYRPDGWTVRQVVHHVPDSHANAYTRFKLALTEDIPTIKPYDESAWAKLDDVRSTPIETSLVLLESLHDRWVRLLRSIAPADFDRQLNHPENGTMNLASAARAVRVARRPPRGPRDESSDAKRLGVTPVTRRCSPATI